MSGLGFELAASILGFGLLGFWVDRHWDTEPWALLAGLLLGSIGGLYNLIKQAIRLGGDPMGNGSKSEE